MESNSRPKPRGILISIGSIALYMTCYSETHATVATGENFEVFRDTFLTLLQRGSTSNSSSPFVKVSKKCQKSVTKDFEISPGGNGSVRLAVIRYESGYPSGTQIWFLPAPMIRYDE